MKYPILARLSELRPYGQVVLVVDRTLDDWAIELGEGENVRVGRRVYVALHAEMADRNIELAFFRGFQ
jgi:hypothetical protein